MAEQKAPRLSGLGGTIKKGASGTYGEAPDGKYKFRVKGLFTAEIPQGDLLKIGISVVSAPTTVPGQANREHQGAEMDMVYFLPADNEELRGDNAARFGADVAKILGGEVPDADIETPAGWSAWQKTLIGCVFVGTKKVKVSEGNGKRYTNVYVDKPASLLPADLEALGLSSKAQALEDDDIPF